MLALVRHLLSINRYSDPKSSMLKLSAFTLLMLTVNMATASSLMDEINGIESDWAKVFYHSAKTDDMAKKEYSRLIAKTQRLEIKYPDATEPIFWEANILASRAEHENIFTALASIETAKTLLKQVIQKDASTLGGAALITLGILYYEMPLTYNRNSMAENHLKEALKINPNGVDPNYFYAEFLRSMDQAIAAIKYYKFALSATVRFEQQFADEQLKNKALINLIALNPKNTIMYTSILCKSNPRTITTLKCKD